MPRQQLETYNLIEIVGLFFSSDIQFCRGGINVERQGFEPWLRYERKHAFQACALSHSATSPKKI